MLSLFLPYKKNGHTLEERLLSHRREWQQGNVVGGKNYYINIRDLHDANETPTTKLS